MKTQAKTPFINFLIEIKHFIPQYKFFSSLNLFFKLLSLFLLTHDWNINFSQGITTYLIEITMIPALSRLNSDITIAVLTLAYIIICFIPIILLLLVYIGEISNSALREKMIAISAMIIFFFYYLFNQHFYMLTIESYFCSPITDDSLDYVKILSIGANCRSPLNYVTIALQSIFIIVIIIIDIFVTLVTFEPFFFSKEILSNNIATNDNQWIVYPFALLILQLEYHIPFKYIAIIKAIVRFIYILFFLYYYLIKRNTVFPNIMIYQIKTMILSMCFASCLIEYAYAYDWNNDLILLQSHISYIVTKIFLEILLAIGIFYYIHYKDHQLLFTFKNFTRPDINEEYALYNKYFFYLLHPYYNISLTNEMIFMIYKDYEDHQKKKCGKTNKDCFCAKYQANEVFSQLKKYQIQSHFYEETLIDEYDIVKNHFPALYYYLQFYCEQALIQVRNESSNIKSYLQLIISLYYLAFQKNINKSFFYIEEFKRSKLYQKSFICQLQVRLIDDFILLQNINIIKHNPSNFISFSAEFKELNDYITIEMNLKQGVQEFIEFIHNASLLQINQSFFFKALLKFNTFLHQNHKKNKSLLSQAKCLSNHLSTKLYIYYSFFYSIIPTEMEDLFKDITKEKENFLSLDDYSTLIIKYSFDKRSQFTIDYASDELLHSLSYTHTEFIHKDFNDILVSEFSDGYSAYLYEQIQLGATSLVIPSICLKTHQSDCKIFFFLGLILFYDNNLYIFAKITPVDSIPFSKLDMFFYNDPKYLNSKKSKLIERDSCYVLSDKSGKLIALSADFESFFCLKNVFVKLRKINIIRDIFRQANTKDMTYFTIPLLTVYENIADLISNYLLENHQDSYELDYRHIIYLKKTILEQKSKVTLLVFFERDIIQRTKKQPKQFYYIIFKIQQGHQHPISLHEFFNTKMHFNSQINIPQTIAPNDSGIKSKSSTPLSMKLTMPSLNDNKYDIIQKVTLIRHLSFKFLCNVYNISNYYFEKSILQHEQEQEQKPKTSTKRASLKTSQSVSNEDYVYEKMSLNEIRQLTKSQRDYSNLLLFFLIWIICLLLFFIFYILIGQIKSTYHEGGLQIVYCNLFITMTKKAMITILSSVLYMQFQTNEIQGNTIDQGFPNDKNYHASLLNGRIEDFTTNYQLFRSHFLSKKVDMGRYSSFVDQIFYEYFNVTEIGVYLISINYTTNMANALSYLHMKTAQGFHDLLYPMMFNQSFTQDGIQYSNYSTDDWLDYDYLTTDQGTILSEKILVYLIENTMTEFKYRLDEFVHVFELVSLEHNSKAISQVLFFNSCNALFIIFFFIFQAIQYFIMNKKLFVNSFMMYVNLQFFNQYLVNKALIIKKHMDMTIQSTFDELKYTKIIIRNSNEENNMIRIASRIIEEDHPIDIHSFNCIVNIGNNQNKHHDNAKETKDLKMSRDITHNNKTFNDLQIKTNKRHSDYLKSPGKSSRNKTLQTVLKSPTISSKGTNNTINQTTDLLVKNEECPNGNKRILAANFKIAPFLIVILFLVILVILTIIHFILIMAQFNTIQAYIVSQAFTLQKITAFHELLLIFQISILKNKELSVVYKPYGLLNATSELAYFNNITNHNVFNETLSTFIFLEKEYDKAINIANGNAYQKTLKTYENIFNHEDFCHSNGQFFEENKQFLILPLLKGIADINGTYLAESCLKIGGNFNGKGFKSSMMSLVTNIKKEHDDFISQLNRSKEYNLKKLNSQTVQIYQTNSHRLLDSIFMNYQVSTSKDYEFRQKDLSSFETLYTAILMTFLICLVIFYFIYFTLNFKREYNVSDSVEEVLLSSAIF